MQGFLTSAFCRLEFIDVREVASFQRQLSNGSLGTSKLAVWKLGTSKRKAEIGATIRTFLFLSLSIFYYYSFPDFHGLER